MTPSRDPFGVRTLYRDERGRLFERIADAGATTLAPDTWRFDASCRLVRELEPLPLSELPPASPAPLVEALDAAVERVGLPCAPLAEALDAAALTAGGDAAKEKVVPKFVAKASGQAPETTKNGATFHCLLSGGLDSAAIVDSLHRRGARVIAHALLDSATDEEELARARELCAKLRIDLREHVIRDEELPAFFAEAVIAAERPLFNARGVSLALFMKRVRASGVTHAYSGLGADEVFRADRAHHVRAVFEPKTLPPTVWAARHFGLTLLLPYLSDVFVSAAQPSEDKRAFREAVADRLGAAVCFAKKSPRYFSKVSGSQLWRGILKGGDDAAALTAASFEVLERHFANGTNPPRHVA